MKKLLFSLMALVFTTVLFAQKKTADVARFNVDTYDLGKVKHNVPATATYIVTNIGTEPLIMTVTPSCGCTASDYTKSPIAPGKTGYIKAIYNAAALGGINKTVSVKFEGIDDVKTVNLSGEVLEPSAYDAWASKTKVIQLDEKTTVKIKDDKVKTETKTATGATSKVKTKKGKKVGEKSVVKK